MKLTINGEVKSLNEGTEPPTLKKVLHQLGHNPGLVVVEFNGTILIPKKWDTQEVKDGDTIEIVTIVGGGS